VGHPSVRLPPLRPRDTRRCVAVRRSRVIRQRRRRRWALAVRLEVGAELRVCRMCHETLLYYEHLHWMREACFYHEGG